MANTTENYGLTKPLQSDFYDVEVQNGNMDIIDAGMKANADGIKDLQDEQKNKADLVDGKVPSEQLPHMDYIPTTEKGKPGGVATLGPDGKVPAGQLPDIGGFYEVEVEEAVPPASRKANTLYGLILADYTGTGGEG